MAATWDHKKHNVKTMYMLLTIESFIEVILSYKFYKGLEIAEITRLPGLKIIIKNGATSKNT